MVNVSVVGIVYKYQFIHSKSEKHVYVEKFTHYAQIHVLHTRICTGSNTGTGIGMGAHIKLDLKILQQNKRRTARKLKILTSAQSTYDGIKRTVSISLVAVQSFADAWFEQIFAYCYQTLVLGSLDKIFHEIFSCSSGLLSCEFRV